MRAGDETWLGASVSKAGVDWMMLKDRKMMESSASGTKGMRGQLLLCHDHLEL